MNLPGRPKGNPGALHAAASAWRSAASELDQVEIHLTGRSAAMQCWTGSAAASFQASSGSLGSAVGQLVGAMESVAEQLDRIAGSIHDAQSKYDHAVEAAAAATALGIGLTIVTAGASDAVAAAADSALCSTCIAIAAALADVVDGAGVVFLAASDTLISLGSSFAVSFANAMVAQGIAGAATGTGVSPARAAETIGLAKGLGPLFGALTPSFIPTWATNAAGSVGASSSSQLAHTGSVNPVVAGLSGAHGAAATAATGG